MKSSVRRGLDCSGGLRFCLLLLRPKKQKGMVSGLLKEVGSPKNKDKWWASRHLDMTYSFLIQ